MSTKLNVTALILLCATTMLTRVSAEYKPPLSVLDMLPHLREAADEFLAL